MIFMSNIIQGPQLYIETKSALVEEEKQKYEKKENFWGKYD